MTPLTPLGGVVACDLYYPGQQDPIGPDITTTAPYPRTGRACRLRYVVWVRPRPDRTPDELAPRLALHVSVAATHG